MGGPNQIGEQAPLFKADEDSTSQIPPPYKFLWWEGRGEGESS